MAVSIASTSQFLFRRNFNQNKWSKVGEGMCKVQVITKGGEFLFRINEGDKRSEFPLAKESKLHLSKGDKGFVQVPIASTKELYGINFKDTHEAETFYGKVVVAMNQAWCDQKVEVGSDDLPQPYTFFDQRSERPNMVVEDPFASRSNTMPSKPSRSRNDPQLPPQHMQQPIRAGGGFAGGGGGGGRDMADINRGGGGGGPQYPVGGDNMRRPPDRFGAGGGGYNRAGGNQPGGGGGGGGRYPPPHGGGGGLGGQGAGFGGGPGEFGRGPSNPGFNREPAFDRRNDRGRDRFDERFGPPHGPPPSHGPPGPRGPPPSHGPPGPRGPDPNRRVVWDENPPQNPAPSQNHPPNPAHSRPPPPFKRDDLPTVVNQLMQAINDRDTESAHSLLSAFLVSDKSSLNLQLMPQPAKTERKTFVLHIKVEFQQPEKNPLPIFLDAHETDTIDELKTMVQAKFFIPKASQNWIIGDTLVSTTDEKKNLKDFGISVEFVNEVKIFMYVKHAKKAQVPREVFESTRANQMEQRRKQQQGPVNQELMSSPLMADHGGYFHSDLHHQEFRGGRNYAPGPATISTSTAPPPTRAGGHAPPPQRFGQQPSDTAYSQFDMHGTGPRGQDDIVTRNGAPHVQGGGYHGGSGYDKKMHSRGPPNGNAEMMGGHTMREGGDRYPPSRGGDIQAALGIPAQLQNPGLSGMRGHLGAAPLPPPPPEKKEVVWVCECTWRNQPRRLRCEMCSRERPEDFVVPEDAPMDEAAKQEEENERMFQEFLRKEKEEEEKKAQENYRKYLTADDTEAVYNAEKFECSVCYGEIEPGDGLVLRGCIHEFCKECLRHSITNTNKPAPECPFDDGEYVCGAAISEREIRAVVTEEEFETFLRRGLRQAENADDHSFHCKTPDCEGFCFYEDEVNLFPCPICMKQNCLLCKAIHEGMDCKEYQEDLKRRAANDEAARETQKMLEKMVTDGEAMHCPKCNVIVTKKVGCDWIQCVMCRTEICWATKGPRWGPKGKGDTSGGCKCRVGGKKCTPLCRNCH